MRIRRNWTLPMIVEIQDFKKLWCYIRNDSGKGKVNTQIILEADSCPD